MEEIKDSHGWICSATNNTVHHAPQCRPLEQCHRDCHFARLIGTDMPAMFPHCPICRADAAETPDTPPEPSEAGTEPHSEPEDVVLSYPPPEQEAPTWIPIDVIDVKMNVTYPDSDKEHPCPEGDNCALNKGAVLCKRCNRTWPPEPDECFGCERPILDNEKRIFHNGNDYHEDCAQGLLHPNKVCTCPCLPEFGSPSGGKGYIEHDCKVHGMGCYRKRPKVYIDKKFSLTLEVDDVDKWAEDHPMPLEVDPERTPLVEMPIRYDIVKDEDKHPCGECVGTNCCCDPIIGCQGLCNTQAEIDDMSQKFTDHRVASEIVQELKSHLLTKFGVNPPSWAAPTVMLAARAWLDEWHPHSGITLVEIVNVPIPHSEESSLSIAYNLAEAPKPTVDLTVPPQRPGFYVKVQSAVDAQDDIVKTRQGGHTLKAEWQLGYDQGFRDGASLKGFRRFRFWRASRALRKAGDA